MPNRYVPPTRALVFALATMVVALGFALGLYALTAPPDRPALLDWYRGLGPTLLVVAGAGLAWLSGERGRRAAERAEAKVDEVHQKVDQVVEQTNGNMTALIERVGPPEAKP